MVDNDVDRRGVLRGLTTLAVGGLTVGSSGSAAAGPQAPVPKQRARRIARDAADTIGDRPRFEAWSARGIRSPELFYAKVQPDGSVAYRPRSWIFPVERRGRDVGYINVSAIQTEHPVLTYGTGTAPQRNLTEAKRTVPANPSSLDGRFIYHGGVEFGVETTEGRTIDLRSQRQISRPPVEDRQELSPLSDRDGSGSSDKQENQEDWSGPTDYEISGVPNWTEHDEGGASSTSIGTGRDSWYDWDGCIPVATSMVVGYHEGLDDGDDDAREALIDRFHISMDTGDGSRDKYVTKWEDMPPAIEGYSHGSNSYSAANLHYLWTDNARSQISSDRPIVLNMENGPYTGKDGGHSVCAFGYRAESCGWVCTQNYYKIYNGYDESAELVTHGAWSNGCMTRVVPN